MLIVYIPGVWDLLHVGHLAVLERAKALGDRLVVGVPSDDVVAEDKGQPPVIPLADRLRMLAALKCVDLAVPYYRLDFVPHLEMIRPNVLAVGETWGTDERHRYAVYWMRQHGGRVVQLPYTQGISTTDIKARCLGGAE